MKILSLAVFSLLGLVGAAAIFAAPTPAPSADAGLPAPVPASRYATLAKVSLFAPPTAAVAATPPPPPPPQPTWAEGWRLTSLAEIGADRYRLALTRSRPSNDNKVADRVIVTTGESNSEGITLAGVQWSAQPGQTRVTLNRAGVFAVFNFDPSNLQSSPQGVNANVPPMQRPGMVGMPAAMMPPPPPQQQPQTPQQVPQRAGTRTGPIPGAPPPRVFPPTTLPGIMPTPPPANQNDDDEEQ